MDIIASVKSLQLPLSEIIVIGSGIMGARGIKKCNDIDLLVSPAVKETLQSRGWTLSPRTLDDGRIRVWLENPPFEANDEFWNDTTVASYLATPGAVETVAGVQFQSMAQTLAIKREWARPKDIADISLIEAYLATQSPQL